MKTSETVIALIGISVAVALVIVVTYGAYVTFSPFIGSMATIGLIVTTLMVSVIITYKKHPKED